MWGHFLLGLEAEEWQQFPSSGTELSGVNYFSRRVASRVYDNNYELGVTALTAYTGADRSRG